MTKPLPIGVSDYKVLIEDGYYYVDKTLLIKELLLVGGGVTLMPRPRRFGKTLNLSMLRYFFEKAESDTSYLFANTAIWQEPKYRALQGQSSVIFLTFKDVKENNWQAAYTKLVYVIAEEYKRHRPIVEAHSTLLDLDDLEVFNRLATKQGSETEVSQSLKHLTKLLAKITGKRPILLLDEYDAPIHAAFTYDYYDSMIVFMRGLLTAGLKDNEFLRLSAMTGIMRTAKEGIFSGLNNLTVYTVLDNNLSDKFGFTQEEVDLLLTEYSLIDHRETIRTWYNGYTMGTTKVYNPWSVLSCIRAQGVLKPYWANTSDNALIKKLIVRADATAKEDLEIFLQGNGLSEQTITEGVVLPQAFNDSKHLLSFLLFTGYLTTTEHIFRNNKHFYTLAVPNQELAELYEQLVCDAIFEPLVAKNVAMLLDGIITGDAPVVQTLLQEFIIKSCSFHDLPSNEVERSYHLFVLGLLVLLQDRYVVQSNRESGYGRYDIMLIPKNKSNVGIVIEFKKMPENHTTEKAAAVIQSALQQIRDKNYVQQLRDDGVTSRIFCYGIAIESKHVALEMETLPAQPLRRGSG